MSDAALVERLRAGDEDAFAMLVDRYHARLVRLARTFVPSAAIAEEVVQDTWLGVVRGIDRFEGRSSFQTWLYRILVNRARSTGARESRRERLGREEPFTASGERFARDGHWAEPPTPWPDGIEDRLVAESLGARLRQCLEQLPSGQRQVVAMRDVEGLTSREVCDILGLTEVNQRVLLHRGRARLRALLAAEIGEV